MRYRADFYIVENIIGYTGRLHHDPTVYFLTGPPHGPNEYGHITQGHELGPNVGREVVCRSAQYQMLAGAGGALEEWDAGELVHTSRNVFVPITGLNATARYLLGTSIARFTEKKRIDRFTEQQIDQLYDYGRVLGR